MLIYVLKTIKNKKRDFLIVILAVFILSLISVIAFTAAGDIVGRKREEAFNSYGTFVAGGSVESRDDVPYSDGLKTGTYKTIAFYKYNNENISIGTADDNFYELAACHVLEGRLPENENEAAVQKHILRLLGKTTGDYLHLSADGLPEGDYKITGSLNNYSMTLSASAGGEESSIYPSIFVNGAYGDKTKDISYLIGFNNTDEIILDDIKLIQRINNIAGEQNFSLYNDNLIFKGFMYCKELETHAAYFTILIFLLSGLICALLYSFFFKNLRKNYGIFTSLGGSLFIRKLTILQIGLITLASFIMSFATFSIISFTAFSHANRLISQGFLFLAVWYLAYMLLMTAVSLIYITFISKNSVRENLSFSKSSKSKNLRQGFFSTVKYFTVFIIAFLSIFYVNVLYESFTGMPDYDLLSKEAGVSDVIGGYTLDYNTAFSYDCKSVNDILNKYPDMSVQLKPDISNNALVYARTYQNPYLERRNDYLGEPDISAEDSFYVKNRPKEADEFVPCANVNYIILSGEEYANVINLIGASDAGGVLLYVPSDEHDIDAGELGFAGFKRGEGLEFIKYDLKVDGILSRRYAGEVMENTKAYSGDFDPYDEEFLSVFVKYDSLADNIIVNGYSYVSISLGENFSDSKREALEDDLADLQSQVQGGVLYSKKENERKAEEYNIYIRAVSAVLIVITAVIAAVYSLCSVILYIRNNRRRLGIMMVLGQSAVGLSVKRSLQNISRFAVGVLFGILIISISLYDGSNFNLCLLAAALSAGLSAGIMITDDVIFHIFIRRVKFKECIYKI